MTSSDSATSDPRLSDLVANHVAEAFRFWVSCFPGGVHTNADGVEMLETGISHPLGNWPAPFFCTSRKIRLPL